jgi:hypothetical protein
VNILSFYELDDGSSILGKADNSVFVTMLRPSLGPILPPKIWVPRSISLGVKWPELEPDHSLPSGVQVENAYNCICNPHMHIHSLKVQGKFYPF